MKIEAAYIAGFFDGEGSALMGCTAKSISPRMSIVQAGERGRRVLIEIKEFFLSNGVQKVTIYTPKTKGKSPLTKQILWYLHVYNRQDVTQALSLLFPYLRVKKTQVQDILRFCRLCPSLRDNTLLMAEAARKRRLPREEFLRRRTARATAYRILHPEVHRRANAKYKAKLKRRLSGSLR